MSNENKTIHDFDFNFICEYFSQVERQGPGSPEATLKALSFIDQLPEGAQVADLGCGTGGQTMTLAQQLKGEITGLDLFPDFIDLFTRNAAELGVAGRVKGIVGSMDKLPFERGSLDLIWSEGAIYNIGFERGLREWRDYLKQDGYIAVTEASWFTDERPEEIHRFWLDAYPEMDTIPNNVAKFQRAGYLPLAIFCLPENCWTQHFFAPCRQAQEAFLLKYPDNEMAADLVFNQRREEVLYAKYKQFYGYVFYIGKKQ